MGIRCLIFCVILLSLSPVTVSAQEVFRPLRGPYLGQEAGIRPQIFLPGKISSGSDEGSPLFYPGALSFMWMTKRSGVEVAYLLEDRDGRWQQPERVEFFKEPSRVWDLTLAPDGESIYFVSDRQGEFGGANIWWVPLDGGRWGSPQILSAEVNSDAEESHPTVALNGDLYFTRVEPGDRSEADLFVARRKGQAFAPAARLSGSVNAAEADYDPFIAPDGSYLVFASRRPGGSGLGDLYISYRLAAGSEGSTPPDGVLAEREREGREYSPVENWGVPINLGPEINSPAEENCPSITIDGRYFFFISNRINAPELPPGVPPARSMPGSGSLDIYWMTADFLRR